jgi:hypothetical protein
MKALHWLALPALLISPLAWAQVAPNDNRERAADDPTYTSFYFTQAEADYANLDSAINIGGGFGFRFPDFDIVSVGLELSSTIIGGENSGAAGGLLGGGGNGGDDGGSILDPILGGGGDDDDNEDGGSAPRGTRTGDELRVNTFGLFLGLETPRQWSSRFFGTARVGYAYIDSTIPEMVEDGRSQTAFGFGLGYRYGDTGRIELRYTRMSEDLDYISLGYSF